MSDQSTPGDADPSRTSAEPDTVTPRPGSRKRIWLALGVVVTLAVVGAVVGALTLGGDDAPTAEAADPVTAAKDTKLVAPPTLDGRPKIVDGELQAVVDQIRSTVLSVVPGSMTSEVGFYGNMTEQDLLMVVAVTAPITEPGSQLSNAFTSLTGSGVTVTGVTPVDAGPLGGQASCGGATASGAEAAVCGWADSGSLGLVMFYFTDVQTAKGRFAAIRAEVEKR